MAGCDIRALLKTIEVILCLTCLIYKLWTDEEASRLFFYLEKNSREWPLLNNITWNQAGSWFADITFGGYVLITIGLLLAHMLGELKHTQKTETFLLGIGALLFFGVGCMVITSFDNVPDPLIDNAIILGLLSIITGFLFLIDIGCFKKRDHIDKVDRQEKEFRMKRNTVNGGHNMPQSEVYVIEKTTKENGVKKVTDNHDVVQDKMISELRSSMKKKTEKPTDDELTLRLENEKMQTTNHIQSGRRHMENRGFVSKGSRQKRGLDEHDNAYDYDQQSIRNYNDEKPANYPDSDDSAESDVYYRYDRKSRGSQTSRKHFQKIASQEKIMRDAETSTESTHVTKTIVTHYKIQSPTINTTDPHKSDSPTSEEYELHSPPTSSYAGKKFQPIITPSRIERLAQNAKSTNEEIHSVPSSPQDPGYVLHTASKWPHTTPLSPQPYKKWNQNEKILRPVHSAV